MTTGMIGALIVIAALSAADILTTAKALRIGKTEANPLARWLFGRLGVLPAAILLKLIGIAIFVGFALAYPAYWLVLVAYAFLLLGIIANNLFELGG